MTLGGCRDTSMRRTAFSDRDEAYENFAAKRATRDLAGDVLRAYVDHGFVDDPGTGLLRIKCQPTLEAAMYEGADASPLWSQLRPLGCPVTLVGGAAAEELHDRSTAHAAERLRVPVRTLAGVGHFGPLQSPRAFADLV